MKQLNIIDMFCGGGGESTGLISAAYEYDFNINLSAINHWERAIETHAANYPFAEHRIEENKDVCCLPTRAFDFFYIFPYYKLKIFTVFFNHPLFENSIVIREYPKCNEIETEIKFL